MGILKQGILGGISGSVGNVTGSSWKGIAVIKAKPLSVANPKTSAQVAQRGKFSNAVAFAKEILSAVIKPLWDRFAQQKSGFNAFIQENIDLFTSALPATPADLVISKGKMEKTEIDSSSPDAGVNGISVTWTDDSGEGMKLATDVPYIVAVNQDTGEIVGQSYDGSKTRADEALGIDMDSITAGDVCDVYLAFRRADGTVVSNTSYKQATAS
jgi:hypothetical protein